MAKIHLLGPFELVSDDGVPVDLAGKQKRLALLAYLAMATPTGFQRRESLLALVWPESDESKARGSLNQSLHQLRRCLGPHLLPGRGEEEVGLDWSRWYCDVVDFRTAVAAGRLEEALVLYRGELLPGFGSGLSQEYCEWLDNQRATLRRAATGAAVELCDRADEEGRTWDAVAWLRRASEIEPLDADHAHGIMQRLHRCGRDRAALAEYESFVQRLAAYELEPPQLLRAYASKLRERRLLPADPPMGFEADNRPAAPREHRSRYPVRKAVAVGLLLAAGLAAGALAVGSDEGWPPVQSLAARGELDLGKAVVLADFTDRTGEENLAEGITEAFRIDFGQSVRIRLAPPAQVQQARLRMNIPASTRLHPDLARELAIREGIEAVLTGEVSALGSGYVIAAQLLSAGDGRVLLSRRVTAAGPADVISAVDRLSAWMRRRIGDSLQGLVDNEPLDAVTTSSLEALKAYSAALQPLDIHSERSVLLFEQAIALDSTFAAAYRHLGVWLYLRGGNRARVVELLTRAYDLRHRLTARERLLVEGTYYHYAAEDYERAVTAFEQMLARDSLDYAALDHLERLFWRLRQTERSLEMHRRRAAITSQALSCSLLYAAGRTEEAERTLLQGLATDTITIYPFDELVRFKAIHGDLAAADSFARLGIERARKRGSSSAQDRMLYLQSMLRMLGGNSAEGAALLDAAARLPEPVVRPAGALDKAHRLAAFDALVAHDPARARARLHAGLQQVPLASIPLADRPYVGLATGYVLAGDTAAAARMMSAAREAGALERTDGAWRPHLTAALLHAHRGHANSALAEIDTGLRRAYSPRCINAARAMVHEVLGVRDSAIIAWQAVLRETDPNFDCFATFATYARERLAELHSRHGNVESAAACARELIAFWTNPDARVLPRLERARQLAALEQAPQPMHAPPASRCSGA